MRLPTALSGTPVTVTVWAVSQLPAVNVSGTETVAIPISLLAGVTVTLAVGWIVKATLYVAVLPSPASVTATAAGAILRPGSLSVMISVAAVIVAILVSMPLTTNVSSPSAKASSISVSVKLPLPGIEGPSESLMLKSGTASKSSPGVAVPPLTETGMIVIPVRAMASSSQRA